MKLLVPLISLLLFYGAVERSDAWNTLVGYPTLAISEPCLYPDTDVTFDYQRALYTFGVKLIKSIVLNQHNYHISLSPLSAWLSLAAFAEGSDGRAKEELLLALGLPNNKCLRQRYYRVALESEAPNSDDVILARTRMLAFDENLKVNQYWTDTANQLLTGVSFPLKRNPEASIDAMRQLLGARISTINLKGNSVILDSFLPQIIWTDSFSDVIVKDTPFYNDAGEQVGTVDMMTIKKRVRMCYHPREQWKAIELPIGYNDRYRMVVIMSVRSTTQSVDLIGDSTMFSIFNELRPTKNPIEVALPRFAMTSEIDLRNVLEDIGLQRIWNDPSATRNISDPAALPSGLFQRSTIILDNAGINPYREDDVNIGLRDEETFYHPTHGRDFIANKLFGLVLVDTKAHSILFTTIFSKPTNNFLQK